MRLSTFVATSVLLLSAQIIEAAQKRGELRPAKQKAVSNLTESGAYPKPVVEALKGMADMCRDGTGDPGRPGSAVQRIDINGDGRPDYLVFQGAYDCTQGISLMAPTAAAGVPTKLYLGQADGSVDNVWEEDTWGPDTIRNGRMAAYTFMMSGYVCGDNRGASVSVAERRSCTLQLRPDNAGKWDLRPLVRGRPVAIMTGEVHPSRARAAGTHVSIRSSSPIAPAPPPLMVAANAVLPEAYRAGTFRFSTSSKKICSALYDSAAPMIASARGAGDWIKVASNTLAADCGADVAYYLLGEAAERIGYRAAALSYYQEASRIASTASLRFSEHCTLNKSGTGFQSAGPACFGVPIETASRDAVSRMRAVVMAAASTTPAAARLSGAISYAGSSSYKGYSTIQDFELSIAGDSISGTVAGQVMGRLFTVPVSGTYANGICSVQIKSDTLTGPCTAHGFSGQRFSQRGEVVGSFELRNADELPPVSSYAQARSEAPVQSAQSGPSSVWALGRVRILVEHGSRCGPDVNLGKSFCFGEAIDWLRRRPQRNDVDVIAMDQSYVPGSMVPYNNGQGWDVYQVSKRGNGFAADRHLHFATEVKVPQGCIFNGVQQEAWYITVARGRRVAVEAKLYACEGWRGPTMYAGNADYTFVDVDSLDYTSGAQSYVNNQVQESTNRGMMNEIGDKMRRDMFQRMDALSQIVPDTPAERGCLDERQVNMYLGLRGVMPSNPCPSVKKHKK